eukprot:9492-Heterococcus_DN1.PRE.1
MNKLQPAVDLQCCCIMLTCALPLALIVTLSGHKKSPAASSHSSSTRRSVPVSMPIAETYQHQHTKRPAPEPATSSIKLRRLSEPPAPVPDPHIQLQ